MEPGMVKVDVKCWHCHTVIALEKPASKARGKLVCPACNTRLSIVFDTEADPQTCSFIIGSGEFDKADAPCRDTSKNGEASDSGKTKESAGDAENRMRSDAGKNKTVYKKDVEGDSGPPRRHSVRRTPPVSDVDDEDDYSDFDFEEERSRRRKKNRSSSNIRLPYRVSLVRKRHFGLVTERYDLSGGSNIVGRYDPDDQSDIAIPGDSSISRRSVELTVETEGRDAVCSIRVLNATNPVTVNGHEIRRGDSTALFFGDTLRLGKTSLKLEHD